MGEDGVLESKTQVQQTAIFSSIENSLKDFVQCSLISAGPKRKTLEEASFQIFHIIQALLKDMDLEILPHKRDLKLLKTAQTLVRMAIQWPKWPREFYLCLIRQKNDKTDVALLMALWSVIAVVIYIIPCPSVCADVTDTDIHSFLFVGPPGKSAGVCGLGVESWHSRFALWRCDTHQR